MSADELFLPWSIGGHRVAGGAFVGINDRRGATIAGADTLVAAEYLVRVCNAYAAPANETTVYEWFNKAADEAAKQGRHESAQLWRDGLAVLNSKRAQIKRQREAFLDFLADAAFEYEGEGERDQWAHRPLATQAIPLDTLADAFGFRGAQDAYDQIDGPTGEPEL